MAKKENSTFMVPLHLACASDPNRPVLNYVHFIDGYAYATDGFIAIESSIDYYCKVIDKHNLSGHSIHRDAYALAAKCPTVVATGEGLRCQTRGGGESFMPYANMTALGLKVPDIPGLMRGMTRSIDQIVIKSRYMAILDRCLVHSPNSSLRITEQMERNAILLAVDDYIGQRAVLVTLII